MPKQGLVDALLDDLGELRMDSLGDVREARGKVLGAMRLLVEVNNSLVVMDARFVAEENGVEGGSMWRILGLLREAPAIRRNRSWSHREMISS